MTENHSNPELNARILKDSDDVSAYLVYSDWLSERGDPRGELIAVQAKLRELAPPPPPFVLPYSRRRRRRAAAADAAPPIPAHIAELLEREKKLLEENAATWLGDLAKHISPTEKDIGFRFRLGFLDAFRIGPSITDDRTSPINFEETYRTLMTAVPHTQFIRELVMGAQEADDPDWQNTVDVICECGVPIALTSLVFDCGGYWDISNTHLGDLSDAYAKLATLRSLRIRMGAMSLGDVMRLPELESLEIITGGLQKANIASIAAATWPKLSRLSLCIGQKDNDYGCTVGVEELKPIFEGANLGAVRHLGLCNSGDADEIAEALATSHILPQLETLDLSMGTFGDRGARAIVANANAFKHLRQINLTHHYVNEELRAALAKIGVPEVIVDDYEGPSPSESADEDDDEGEADDRYVQISE